MAAAFDFLRGLFELKCSVACLEVTVVAEVGAVEAHIKGYFTAESTLVIDEVISMSLTHSLTKTKLFRQALFAPEMLFESSIFFSHPVLAIIHATKVRLLAYKAFIESAGSKGNFSKIIHMLVPRFEAGLKPGP